jgi:hypothetical protein
MIINCPDCNGRGVRILKISRKRCERCKGTGKAWVSPYSNEYTPNIRWVRVITFSIPAAAEFDLDALLLAKNMLKAFDSLPASLPSPFINMI